MTVKQIVVLSLISVALAACASPKQVVVGTGTGLSNEATSYTSSASGEMDPVLRALGRGLANMHVEGKLSSSGPPSMSRMPFTSDLDSSGRFMLTMGGPFGITAAKMVASLDTFVLVNYILQEVWDGNPHSPALKTASRLPIETTDLMLLLRGRPPGDASAFERTPERNDGTILFTRRNNTSVDFLLVDPDANVIKRYQKKDVNGDKLLDVSFRNVKDVNGFPIPHHISVSANNGKSTASLLLESVRINGPEIESMKVSIPSSFTRKTFR